MSVGQQCAGLPNGSVVVETPDGTLTTWYTDELAPDDVLDAWMGVTGLWLLLDRQADGGRAVLARLDAPGDVRVVSTWGSIGSSPPLEYGNIEGAAPDESLFVVAAAGGALVHPGTGRAMPMDGDLLGFVPASVADGWPGTAFRALDPVASAARSQPAPTLRPFDTIIAEQLTAADRVLWRGEHLATDEPAASPSTFEIGPLELDTGIGVFLACSGPSDVLVTAESVDGSAADVPPLPVLSRCLAADELAGGYVPAAVIGRPMRFRVTASADTSWRLLIFDPAPGE
jgi:hypothetical protein